MRAKLQMRQDDVIVTVVDVHPEQALYLRNKSIKTSAYGKIFQPSASEIAANTVELSQKPRLSNLSALSNSPGMRRSKTSVVNHNNTNNSNDHSNNREMDVSTHGKVSTSALSAADMEFNEDADVYEDEDGVDGKLEDEDVSEDPFTNDTIVKLPLQREVQSCCLS